MLSSKKSSPWSTRLDCCWLPEAWPAAAQAAQSWKLGGRPSERAFVASSKFLVVRRTYS